MKEFKAIIAAYEIAKFKHQKTALATVVQVDGSAYRRPGARMLVSESGELTGAISGGCLEGDALRKAQTVIFQQESMLVTYDTTDEDDQKFGIGLGCNGIIQILIEPIVGSNLSNPIELLKLAVQDRIESTLVTVFSLKHSKSAQIGTLFLWKQGIGIGNYQTLEQNLWKNIQEELTNRAHPLSVIYAYPEFDEINIFYERIEPAIRILLFGAGNDTIPIAKLADLLGWEVVLVDGRTSHANKIRFPTVQKIIISPAIEAQNHLDIDGMTIALLMTHNFEYESIILESLKDFNLPYIGILGPKKKGLKLLERLEQKGIQFPLTTIYSPTGLDIGAEGSEEIALAVFAEIKAVLSKKDPIFLRDKIGPIH